MRDRLNNLFRITKQDDITRSMATLHDTMVFAAGDPTSDIMFIGTGPGAEEEQQKKPFVGPSGQKLDGILKAMGLAREKVYLTNLLKYRPRIGDGRHQMDKNRLPTPEEVAVSLKIVRSEIEVIKPKLIVALGKTAAEGLIEQSSSVNSLRGQTFQLDGIPVIVTYHPSHLVKLDTEPDKEYARQEKRKVWEDMLRAMEMLGLPISEKQRGFFS